MVQTDCAVVWRLAALYDACGHGATDGRQGATFEAVYQQHRPDSDGGQQVLRRDRANSLAVVPGVQLWARFELSFLGKSTLHWTPDSASPLPRVQRARAPLYKLLSTPVCIWCSSRIAVLRPSAQQPDLALPTHKGFLELQYPHVNPGSRW